jgi:DNA-binding NtrC family response regulator
LIYELCVFFGDEVRRIPLPGPGEYTIGRAEGSAVRIDHPSVSRRHALLTLGDRLLIRDLGSANGTEVRDRNRPSSADETENVHRLADEEAEIGIGDLVGVGVVTLVVRRGGNESTADRVANKADDGLIIAAPAMKELYDQAARIAAAPISVLILGETGVGKELLARTIHARSGRAGGPLLSINCGGLAESIVEGELFGYEKGAFTGAVQARPGLFEAAKGGTVFLDEVGELPSTTQAKLLRVLEDRTVMRLGAREARTIDVRFVAATNRDLEALASEGKFRQDLYFRLNGVSLLIPPLRERKSEIEPLALRFVELARRALDRHEALVLAEETLIRLRAHSWPGNVRELRNVIDRASVLCPGGTILPEHLPAQLAKSALLAASAEDAAAKAAALGAVVDATVDPGEALRAYVRTQERARIADALAQSAGNQTQAAQLLGISRRALVNKLGEFGFPRPRRPREE